MWVDPGHPTKMPYQGLVIDWRMLNHTWMALVVYIDDQSSNDRRTVQRWVRPEALSPITSDPNATRTKPRSWR